MSHDELPLDHVNDCDRAPAPLPPARHLFDPRGHDAGDEDAGTTGERIALLMSKIDTHRPLSITLDDGVVIAEFGGQVGDWGPSPIAKLIVLCACALARSPAPLSPHLFTCRGCGRGFSSARALGWRSHAAHPFLGDDHHER